MDFGLFAGERRIRGYICTGCAGRKWWKECTGGEPISDLKTRFNETTTLSYYYNNSLEYKTRQSRSKSLNPWNFFQKYIDIDVDLMDTILRCNFNYQVVGHK